MVPEILIRKVHTETRAAHKVSLSGMCRFMAPKEFLTIVELYLSAAGMTLEVFMIILDVVLQGGIIGKPQLTHIQYELKLILLKNDTKVVLNLTQANSSFLINYLYMRLIKRSDVLSVAKSAIFRSNIINWSVKS
uniref:Uncharacterized protein n=1 Tax=Anopheles culicifacies TaxID=139723 RepID=A0A182ML21_9DIPT